MKQICFILYFFIFVLPCLSGADDAVLNLWSGKWCELAGQGKWQIAAKHGRVCSPYGSEQMVYHMTDAEQIASIVSAFEGNEKIKYPAIHASRSYRIHFESERYPGLYYTLTYLEYAEDYVVEDTNYGKYFLYNPFDQIFVPVGDEIYQALGPK